MNKNKRLTFKDLINKKLKLEESKIEFKDIYIRKLEGELLFKVPKVVEMLRVADIIRNNNQSAEVAYEEYKKLIYLACETLQNNELHEAYGIVDPFDIIEIMIDADQVMEIGNIFGELVGITDSTVEEDVKN